MITAFNLLRPGRWPALLLAALLAIPAGARAQMFSVDNAPRDRSIPGMAIYAGWESIDFDYRGGEAGFGEAAALYAFNGSIVRLAAETYGFTFYLGTGGEATGLDDITYFDAGIEAGYGFALHRGEHVLLQLPVRIHSGLTRVSNSRMVAPGVPEFQQGALSLAGGLELHVRPSPRFRLSGSVLPSYGLTFSTRTRDAGGSILGLEGNARIYFDRLFGAAGLALGYTYELRDYAVEGQLLDYRLGGHSALIGITF